LSELVLNVNHYLYGLAVTGKSSGDVAVSADKDITGNEVPSAKDKEIGFLKGSQIEVCSSILIYFSFSYILSCF
jgi:hypothetical protein